MKGMYRFGYFIMRIWKPLTGFKVKNWENIPKEGPVIVVSNHLSLSDPIVIAAWFPYQIHFIAKADFAKRRFVRWLFTKLGAFFVQRDEADLAAIKKSLTYLKQNKSLGIFAEGRRSFSGELGEMKQGSVFLALKAKVPIVPVAVINPYHLWRFWHRDVELRVGEPFRVEGDLPTAELLEKYTILLRERVKGLL